MLEEIRKHIKEQKFDLARKKIEELTHTSLTQAERLELLLISLKISFSSTYYREALQLCYELKLDSTFVELTEQFQKLNHRTKLMKAAVWIRSGSLHRSYELLQELTEELFSTGKIQLLEELVALVAHSPTMSEIFERAKYLLALLKGDRGFLELSSFWPDEEFTRIFNRHPNIFKYNESIYLLRLKQLLKQEEREKFIKGCLEFAAIFGSNMKLAQIISEYSARHKRMNLGYEVGKIYANAASLFPERVEEAEVEIGDIDSAEDLFGSVSDNNEELVRNKIQALLQLEQEDQATVLLKDHLLKNPGSELKQTFAELMGSRSGTTLVQRRVDIDEVMGNLLKLTSRGEEVRPLAFDLNQRSLLHFLKEQKPQFLSQNFRDLISCFIMLAFYDLAQWLIDKVVEISPEMTLEARFLRCDIYLLSGGYHHCLDETLSIWNQFDLKFDEELEILYKRAECYRLMGKRQKAFEIYHEVFQRNPTYRLTKIRLQEFE